MSGGTRGMDGPDDVDAAFAEIVAGLAREGVTPNWPEHDEANEPPAGHTPTTTALSGRPSSGDLDSLTGKGQQPSDSLTGPDAQLAKSTRGPDQPPSEEDHFVPPEPPPLPRLRRSTVMGIALLVVGLLLLVAPGLLGLASRISTPLALVAIAGGIGWLVLRMRQGPPPDSGWDDGAQL